jgi:hypothetical protein
MPFFPLHVKSSAAKKTLALLCAGPKEKIEPDARKKGK